MGQHKYNPTALAAKRGELPKVKRWEDLDGMTSRDGRYKIEVDLTHGCGNIIPTFELTPDDNYFDHHIYLSTHTFYEKAQKTYQKIFKKYGFDVEIISWG